MEEQTLRIPRHVAVIPDGNRRYARAHGMTAAEGYMLGLENVIDTTRWLLSKGVRHVSAYAASHENVLERPRVEMIAVFTALGRFMAELEKVPGVGLHIFGNLEELPDWIPGLARLKDLREPRTEDVLTVHFAVNYTGSSEQAYILAQAREHGLEAVAADPEKYALSRGVPSVDLVFRSGGQQRLSGFLPFQACYSELWFSPKYWPEITVADVQESFDWYASQKRNFGK